MLSLLSLLAPGGVRALLGLDSKECLPRLPSSISSPAAKRSAKAHSYEKHTGAHVTDLSDEAFLSEVKQVMRDFLRDISYKPMGTIPNPKLRQETRDEILSWNATDLSPAFIDGLTDTAVSMAEFGCSHTSYEHQRYVAFYTSYLVVADDLGKYNLEAIGQFARRLTCGQPQLHPALDRLVDLLRTTHDLYPRMYVEVRTKDKAVLPAASRYPYYIRCKVGVAAGYSHFCFMKHWADNAETELFYLQSIPDLEVITVFVNDILSFYKEALAGENDNYIHLRAAAEQKPVIQVFREVVDETMESAQKLAELGAVQPGLAAICNDYIMGYIDFHFAAKRYRLQDLQDLEIA